MMNFTAISKQLADLTELPIWILWRIEKRKGKQTKVPYSPKYVGRAKSDDPATWGTYKMCCDIYQNNLMDYNGIGICLPVDSSLIFTDIDNCINENGELDERASDILDVFKGQYVEVSQSGSGIHILALGKIERNFKNSKNGVEMYCNNRFCAMTGQSMGDGSPFINQDAIDYVFQKYKTKKTVTTYIRPDESILQKDDNWIINHASKVGMKFEALYSGRWSNFYSSQSEGDLGLCVILAFWTDKDPERIDRIFRSSGLYRIKWERKDYRENTIRIACSRCDNTITEYIQKKRKEEGAMLKNELLSRW